MASQAQTQQRITAIKADIAALRLQHKVIAERANLDEMTISRVLAGKVTPLSTTLDAIESVVADEKNALRKRLNETAPASPAA